MAPLPSDSKLEAEIKSLIQTHKVVIFSKTTCPFCTRAKDLLVRLDKAFHSVELDQLDNTAEFQETLLAMTGQKTVPNIFINGEHIGGNDKFQGLFREGQLTAQLRTHDFQYDLIVIGGGSGGLAAAKEAVRFGAKVAVFDFVTATPIGTSWGLGGTCVNVGCIPKKLMHQAALLREAITDSVHYGWNGLSEETVTINWNFMRQAVQDHIGSLNWGYRVQLRDKKVDYQNRWATLVDSHTVNARDRLGKEQTFSADKMLIAVGERPNYPDIPGAKEFGITSDDLFSLENPPGDTVVIGASYVALECAGFLATMGFNVTVVVRSILLRGFDQEMSELIGKFMANHKVKFLRPAVPVKLEKTPDGRRLLTVKYEDQETQLACDTVLFAVGRSPVLESFNFGKLGISISKAGRIVVDEADRTSVGNIFAIGDTAEGRPQLTPAAIQAGKLLSRRLYGGSKLNCDYDNIPTTVFTPLEYSCCGLSEDDALSKLGKDGYIVYHQYFTPLEWTVSHREDNACYLKIICAKAEAEEQQKILGIHYLGPNAGEVMQGFALAIKAGASKFDLDMTVGIHPTNAEWFTLLNVFKGSGLAATTSGC